MSKATFFTCFCVMSLNLYGYFDAKPIPGFQLLGNDTLTTIQIPRAIISRDELIALAQYTMRMMASRINITLQATASHTDFPEYPEHAQVSSGVGQSTTSTLSKYYDNIGNVKQLGEPILEYADQKLTHPCRTVGGTENSELLGDAELLLMSNGARLPMNEPPSLTYESFVGYPDRSVESFPSGFDFEVIPNSQISKTYIPRAEESTGTLPLMQHVVKSPSPPSAIPVTSAAGEKDMPSSNIRISNLTIERISSSQPGNAVMSVPFEAVITFTKQKPSTSKLRVENENVVVIPTRDPPDDFPPYFETVFTLGKKTSDAKTGSLNFQLEKNLNLSRDAVSESEADNADGVSKPMTKRQTSRIGDLLSMIGFSTKGSKGNRRGSTRSAALSSPSVRAPRNMNFQNFSSVTLEESTTSKPEGVPMFQRQEIEETDEGGSLGSIADLLPLVLPILEDLSDPNTETDIAALLQAGLPLVQGLLQGDGENAGLDLVGIVTPIFARLSGPNPNGNGTVLQAILPSVLPLIIPFIGPIVGPIIQASSSPPDQGGSSITPIIQAIAGPLSLPTQPGGVSIASSLLSGIIASLSRDLKAGAGKGGSDIGALISTVVSGVLAGGSAGISAEFMKPPPPARSVYGAYGQGPVPASSIDTLDLVGASLKEILGLTLQLVKSVISSVTGILGASSAEQPRPVYGPANANLHVT